MELMHPFFIKPPIEIVTYLRGDEIVNKAINISLCTSVKKSRLKWYPDNYGIPSIEFGGIDEKWVFNSDTYRDNIYNLITSNEFSKIGNDK